MDETEIRTFFQSLIKKDPDISPAVAALQTLMEFLNNDKSETMAGLLDSLKKVKEILTETGTAVTSISSSCAIFLQFITRTYLENENFAECKDTLLTRGRVYITKAKDARKKIAKLGNPFILDGSTILTHSCSRVVYYTLLEAAREKKRFKVYITESGPDKSGHELMRLLQKENISCTLILDAAVGYIMEQVDFILIGAEGVVENGGIINKIGTFPLSVCAREMHLPIYVLVESYKFVRLYPLGQRDIPSQFKFSSTKLKAKEDLSTEHPLVDYTPPRYISLLFTDLGILTPSAVSDELIKLYL